MCDWWRKRDQAERSLILVGVMLTALLAGMLGVCGAQQSSPLIDLSKAILLPAPEGRLWLVFVQDGKPIALAVQAGPVQPGPGPVIPPEPEKPKTIDQIAEAEARKLPAEARKDAGTLAQVYRATAGQFKPGGPIGTFAQAIAIQREARDKVLGAKSAAWNPVAETLGKWLNDEVAAGRLKKDDMPALAKIMSGIAEGLERVR